MLGEELEAEPRMFSWEMERPSSVTMRFVLENGGVN